jgi:hypothetical protein
MTLQEIEDRINALMPEAKVTIYELPRPEDGTFITASGQYLAFWTDVESIVVADMRTTIGEKEVRATWAWSRQGLFKFPSTIMSRIVKALWSEIIDEIDERFDEQEEDEDND